MIIRYCVLAIGILMWGCSGNQSPEKVALAFNEAIARNDLKLAKNYASSNTIRTLEQFEKVMDEMMKLEAEKKEI